MLGKLIQKSINRPITTTVICCGIVIAGIFAILELPLEIFPSIDLPRLYVITRWPGASPYTVESELTSLVEAELASIKGISEIKSYSREGASQVELEIHRDADVNYIQFVVQEKLSFLLDRLPPQVYPPRATKYIPSEFSTSRFLSYHAVGPMDGAELRELAIEKIIPVVRNIPGIAGVDVIGGRTRQIQIVFDETLMNTWNISVSDIFRAVDNADFVVTIGDFIEADRKCRILLRENLSTLDDLRKIPIKYIDQHCVFLDDVADITIGLSPDYSIQRINGEPTVLVAIEREPNTNIIRLASRVKEKIRTIEHRLPQGVKLIEEDDQSTIIMDTLRQLAIRTIICFLIVLVMLTLFLRNICHTALIQASIVISLLFTVLIMFVSHYSLNIITIAGLALALGFLVDNSIVVHENIFSYAERGMRPDSAALHGSLAITRPIVASTMTTIAALVPFLYFQEELRVYYVPFAVTVSVALVASLIVSFTLIPSLTSRFYRNDTPHQHKDGTVGTKIDSKISSRTRDAYAAVARKCLKHPLIVLLITVWLFGIPFWKLPSRIESPRNNASAEWIVRPYNFLMDSNAMRSVRPYLDHILGGSLYLFNRYVERYDFRNLSEATHLKCYIRLPSGSPIVETNKVTKSLESAISGTQGISQIRANVNESSASITITFEPDIERGMIPVLVREKLITRAIQIGNARISVYGYGPGFISEGAGITLQNRLILTGYNYVELERCLDSIVENLVKHKRVRNIRTDFTTHYFPTEVFENTLELEEDRMASWQISSSEVIHQVNPYLSHYLYRQRLRVGDEEIPFAVQSMQYQDFQLSQLQCIALTNRAGQKVPLSCISSIRGERIPPVIERENQQYFRLIAFDYMASYSYTQRFIKRFLQSTQLPPGYLLRLPEHDSRDMGNKRDIPIALAVALLLMFLVLAGLYESLTYPFLVFLIIPLSLIGVFMIYFSTGAIFNQSAYIGVIFLFGIVLNNAIILVDRINILRIEKRRMPFEELLVEAGQERLRPILITTLTTIGGLMPMILLSTLRSSNDIWYSLSLSTVGGLLSGTALGLVAIPAVLLLAHRISSLLRYRRPDLNGPALFSKVSNKRESPQPRSKIPPA